MSDPEPLFVVFDGPPGHESGRFVEVETAAGRSVKAPGSWHEHPTAPGLWRLGPFAHALCQNSREGVIEAIDLGAEACPLCGNGPAAHPPEAPG